MVSVSQYIIKTYRKGFEDAQSEIYREKPWAHFIRPSPEELLEIHSQAGFDPSMNFYAFRRGEMVGFITSSIKEGDSGGKVADMYMPIVRYWEEEAQDELFRIALKVFEERGVTQIVSNMGSEWDNLQGFPEKWGFTRTEDWVYSVARDTSLIDLSGYPEPPCLVRFDENKHGEALLQHLMARRGQTRDTARRLMSNRYFRTDLVWSSIDEGGLRALVRMRPCTHEPLSHLIWLRAFELEDPNDPELIRGLYRFSVNYAIEEGFRILDFNIGHVSYPVDRVQFEAIGEEPEVVRYEVRKTL
jgi:hypothetical protein